MVTNIVMLVLEMVKMLLVLCGCLNYKMKRRFTGAWVVFGVSVVLLVIKGIQDSTYQVNTFYFIVVVITAMMLEGKKKGLLALVAFLGISCVDSIMVPVVQSMFGISEEELYRNSLIYAATNTISLVGITIAAILLQKLYFTRGRKGNQQIHNSSRLYLALFAIGLTAVLFFMTPIFGEGFRWSKRTLTVVVVSILVFAVMFLIMGIFLIYNSNAKRYYKEVAKMNQDLLDSTERYYQMLLEKEEETRRFRHDISSHLTCLKRLLEEKKTEEAAEYLNNLGGVMRELTVKHQTGNMLVNAIVNDISEKYAEVALDWKGHLPQQLEMSNMDICVIFSNLLENAFFAASACEEGFVDVTVESVSGALTITMENNMAKAIEEKEGKLITQKADKRNHGFGTRNVRDCVAKNDGQITFDYTEKSFTVKMVLLNVA